MWRNNLVPVVGLRSRFRRFDAFETFEKMNEGCARQTDVQTVVAVVTSTETQTENMNIFADVIVTSS